MIQKYGTIVVWSEPKDMPGDQKYIKWGGDLNDKWIYFAEEDGSEIAFNFFASPVAAHRHIVIKSLHRFNPGLKPYVVFYISCCRCHNSFFIPESLLTEEDMKNAGEFECCLKKGAPLY